MACELEIQDAMKHLGLEPRRVVDVRKTGVLRFTLGTVLVRAGVWLMGCEFRAAKTGTADP